MNAARHFALSFFAPIIAGLLFCGAAALFSDFFDKHKISLPLVMLGGFVAIAYATRWAVRTYCTVTCPFCGGKSYELPGRGNRFMCVVCGKDH